MRIQGIHSISTISSQIEALSREMDNLNASSMQVQALTCNLCERAHANTDCQVGNSFVHSSDQANYVGNLQGQNNFQRPPVNP